MIDLNDTYNQADNIVTRKVMDEIMLVPIRGDIARMDNIFTLNPVGFFIWKQLDGSQSLRAISRNMGDLYDAPVATIENDVCTLAKDLSEAELIHRCK